ncbi:MAG: cytochrome c biogenesis protein CcsA, partial [Actinomycetota bacterium]|nr:cytochrome c biogenesis protein CcsA [Actinomycetota bacterium]
LQNHILMAIHPPMLYLGYVGMTVPYAFAMAALVRGDGGKVWLDRTHRWSLISWTFLSLGLLLGAWWSYAVLGWGGYWAWDPVENAALIPWLVATAFIHSAVVQRRRGMLQAWNFVLVIAAFSLTILGTFLTRSGVIDSVHSFTQSPIGPALLGFLGVVVLGSMTLLALRLESVASSPRLESLASREGLFLFNNLLLTVFALTVLIGTLYPLLVEAFGGGQLSVGRPFFDRAAVPLAFTLLLAMGVGPITPYRVARPAVVWPRIRTPLRVALVSGAAAVLVGVRSVPTVIAVVLAAFVIGVIARHLLTLAAARPGRRLAAVGKVVSGDRPYWGGQLAHVGIALCAVAITTSSALATRGEVTLVPGETGQAAGYCVRYDGPFTVNEPNRVVEGANVTQLSEDCATAIRTMAPRVNRYPNSPQPVATPDVRTGLVEDVYVTLAGGGSAELLISVAVFPLMWLLWAGGLIVVAGGLWSVSGRRVARPPARHDLATAEVTVDG